MKPQSNYRQSSKERIAVLEEAAHKLVEGRYNPRCPDRSEEFENDARQWTVWLTREEHARYRKALDA